MLCSLLCIGVTLIWNRGDGCIEFLQGLTTNDLSPLLEGSTGEAGEAVTSSTGNFRISSHSL